MRSSIFLTCLLVLSSAPAQEQEESPDAIFINGNVYTMDPARPRAEAMAVRGGRILRIGAHAEIEGLKGERTKVVSLEGRTVVPGLIDAHGHMAGLGTILSGQLDLLQTKSYDELIAAVQKRTETTPKGEWILGLRWDQANWGQPEMPTHERLSVVTPDHPVWLVRVDGHTALANAKAMDAAGITEATPDPSGGSMVRDESGKPTGLFLDNAMDLIRSNIPAGARRNLRDCILAAQERCLSVGLTGVHDAGLSPAEIDVYRALDKEGLLKIRIYGIVHGGYAVRHVQEHEPLIGERLTIRAVKCMIDGSMGARGAWLLEPYADKPAHTGLAVQSPESIETVARVAVAKGYQVCTHAIGDRGIREVLNIYERIHAPEARLRIEHAQNPSMEDIPRFAQLGVIPSMQPTHATSDMRWAEARVGPERIRGAYAWATFLRSGSRIAGGSDFPVESENPLLGIYAAVTRQNGKGEPEGGWRSEERLTREEALRMFTLDAAYAAFEEDLKGSLMPGKFADFAVFSIDVMRCEPAKLLSARCEMTVVGGELVRP